MEKHTIIIEDEETELGRVHAPVPVQLDWIMRTFDFDMVQRAMQTVGWTYGTDDGNLEVPDVPRLRATALRLLERVIANGQGYCGSGGFVASLDGRSLALVFELEAADDDSMDMLDKLAAWDTYEPAQAQQPGERRGGGGE